MSTRPEFRWFTGKSPANFYDGLKMELTGFRPRRPNIRASRIRHFDSSMHTLSVPIQIADPETQWWASVQWPIERELFIMRDSLLHTLPRRN
jgi:hypothetical protein